MKLCVIPARGGSKRIPRKNIKEFCGKPIIAYSIEAAIKSKCFDKIVVSTDDAEIASIAEMYGAQVPFLRPENLADDYTGTIPVVKHAIEYFLAQGINISLVCCIYATAPLIQKRDLQIGLKQLLKEDCEYAFPVTRYSYPIQRALKITSDDRVEMFDKTQYEVRSQDLEDSYHDAGQFYWGKKDSWFHDKSIFSSGSVPIVIPRFRVQDIDTEEDWKLAEFLYKNLGKK